MNIVAFGAVIGVWRPYYAPKLKKRTALFAKLQGGLPTQRQPAGGEGDREINPILRGWVNYFRVGHSSRCFSMVKRLGRKEDPAASDACQETQGDGLETVE